MSRWLVFALFISSALLAGWAAGGVRPWWMGMQDQDDWLSFVVGLAIFAVFSLLTARLMLWLLKAVAGDILGEGGMNAMRFVGYGISIWISLVMLSASTLNWLARAV